MNNQYTQLSRSVVNLLKHRTRRIVYCVLAGLGIVDVSPAMAQPDLGDIFQNTLACALVEPFLADMPVEPVFALQGSSCVSLVPDDTDRPYFTDASCQIPLAFEITPLANHCALLLDESVLGEGEGIDTPVWTLSPGSRMDIGARSLEGVSQPYLQRQIYRTVETPRGTCSLEMRVYSDTPVSPAGNQRPSLLALHGGSWSARGFGFLGLELSIPHYIEQGFVVYAPFYRLLGDTDGSAACHLATIEDVVDDASAALAWVQENASNYGSAQTPVVFGQSAGAHLATSLLVNEPDKVAAAVLFYPPTDFTDFTLRAQQGFYTDEQGLDILARVLGTNADLADINASPIPQNSYPIRIVEQDIAVAPVMMVHGMRDNLVEARQSVRLCDALSGQMLLPVDRESPVITALSQTINCGNDSSLHLIRDGEHALDVCLADLPLATQFCPSGSAASRDKVSDAIADAVSFATRHSGVAMDDSVNQPQVTDEGDAASNGDDSENGQMSSTTSSSGGGAVLWLLLICASVVTTRLFGLQLGFSTTLWRRFLQRNT